MPAIELASLRDHRLMAGLSQRQLAKEAGIGFQTIRRLELHGDAGTVTLTVLARISTALGTTMPALLHGEQPSETRPSPGPASLTISDARLLRKIATTPNAAATLSRTEREITLPRLLRSGLIANLDDRLCLHPDTAEALIP